MVLKKVKLHRQSWWFNVFNYCQIIVFGIQISHILELNQVDHILRESIR